MILKILLVILVLIAAILISAATKPSTFHVERLATIKASPEKVFPLINDLHNCPRWAPQDRKDPWLSVIFAMARLQRLPTRPDIRPRFGCKERTEEESGPK